MASGSLVGRDAELSRLRRAVGDAAAGTGALVLVTGEVGIGKTSLLAAAAARPDAPTTVWGSCRDGPGVPGLWAWVEVLRGCRDEGLLPEARHDESTARALGIVEPDASTPDPDRFAVFDAVGRTLRRVAAEQPLLVVLDDLHRADPGTLRLLRFLVPDLVRSRLLVVGAYRDDEAPPEVRPLLDGLAASAIVLPLRRFDEEQTAALLARLPGARVGPERAAAIYERTAGNPFLAIQLAHLGPDATGLPAGVRETIDRQLSRLPAATLRLLEVAAVAGRDIDARVLARAVDRPLADVLSDVDSATTAGVVGWVAADTAVFAHDLFREALEQRLDPVARAGVHGRLADTLESAAPTGRSGAGAELARHRVGAAAAGDPARAIPYVRAAAEHANAVLAYEEAAGHLAAGVRLAGVAGDLALRRELLVDLADAYRRGGDLAQARRCYVDAAADARAAGDGGALARAALGVHEVGATTWSSHDEAIALLTEALHANDALSDGADAAADARDARLLAALARELAHGPPDRLAALGTGDRAVALARRIGDPETLALCLLAQHDAMWAPGSARQRLAVLDEAAQAAGAAGDPVLAWQAVFGRFAALLELADPAAYPAFQRAVDAAERTGQPHYRWLVLSRRAALAILAGRIDEAETLIDQVAADAERLGEPDGRNVVADLRTQLALLRGGDQLPAIETPLLPGADLPPWMVAQLDGLAHLTRGESQAAADRIRPWVEPALAHSRGWQIVGAAAAYAWIAATAGDAPTCARLYERLRPHAGELVVVGGAVNVTGPVSLYLGMLAAVFGRVDEALDHLADALACAERMDARPWAALVRCETARILLDRDRPGDRADAERHLVAAADAARRLGLAGPARRAQELLAHAGPANVFRRDGDVWTVGYGGVVVRLPDAKGLRDIARLLAAPGREIPAPQLLGVEATAEADTGADPVLDATARSAYRRRLADLDGEIAHAEDAHDIERGARARAERGALIEALTAAYGLGGRARRLGDASERARKAVTARIRDSMGRIEQRHPELGRHLRDAITTGARCSYRPPEPTDWRL
ncbi:MAG TPA: AAA family ATPase [Micromonosporaceae bacterium]